MLGEVQPIDHWAERRRGRPWIRTLGSIDSACCKCRSQVLGLLAFTAEYTCEPVAGKPLPTVAVTGPLAGVDEPPQTRCSDDPSLTALLSKQFGRDISLLDFAPPGASLDQYWPDVPERDFQNVTTELKMPEARSSMPAVQRSHRNP